MNEDTQNNGNWLLQHPIAFSLMLCVVFAAMTDFLAPFLTHHTIRFSHMLSLMVSIATIELKGLSPIYAPFLFGLVMGLVRVRGWGSGILHVLLAAICLLMVSLLSFAVQTQGDMRYVVFLLPRVVFQLFYVVLGLGIGVALAKLDPDLPVGMCRGVVNFLSEHPYYSGLLVAGTLMILTRLPVKPLFQFFSPLITLSFGLIVGRYHVRDFSGYKTALMKIIGILLTVHLAFYLLAAFKGQISPRAGGPFMLLTHAVITFLWTAMALSLGWKLRVEKSRGESVATENPSLLPSAADQSA